MRLLPLKSLLRLLGLIWVTLMAVVFSSGVLAAVDHVVERERVLWPDTQFSAEGLASAPTTPIRQILAAGYGRDPVWVRLRIDPGLTAHRRDERLLLRIRPGYLDEVVLFDPAAAQVPAGITGDRHPLDWQAVPSAVFNLALARSEAPRDIWVRLTSETSRTANFQVVRERDLLLLDAQTMIWSSLYLACLALFAAWGAAQNVARRDWLTAAFVGFQLTSLGYGACVLGVLRLLFAEVPQLPVIVDLMTSYMVLAAVSTSLCFNALLLKEMRAPRWGLMAMIAMIALYPVLAVVIHSGKTSEALRINMLMVLVAPMVSLVVALASRSGVAGLRKIDSPFARGLGLTYFFASMAMTAAAALPGLGVIEGAEISLHIIMMHGVATGLLMLGMLTYRVFLLKQNQELLAAEADFHRQRIQQERGFREDQERLLAMLAHELKTPLATIRMLLGTLGFSERSSVSVHSAIQDMDNVIERCLQVGQLDDDALKVERQSIDLVPIVRRQLEAGHLATRVTVGSSGPLPAAAPLDSDPHLIEVVLRNLLENAAKYSKRDTPIELSLQAGGQESSETAAAHLAPRWTIVVRNEVGAAGKPDPDKVFTKYYRNGQAKRRTGSGLGLYLVHGLVQRLGGSLAYRDEGQHVSFQVALP